MTSPLSKNFFNFFALIASALLLFGCASNEVKGVCKSCKPYYVRGSWHHPQKHYDYDEEGLASWYGPGFHGKPKPHGELYDQFEMTAAHKTLPIPTIAEVTNLKSGKTIRVLVDDRGPYVYEGRIIDLSVAAAKELGCYGKGIAKVRVKALPQESDRFARHLARFKNAKDPNGRRWVQVYQQDMARHTHELRSTHFVQNASPVAAPQQQLIANINTPEQESKGIVLHKPADSKPKLIHVEPTPTIQRVSTKIKTKKHEPALQKVVLKTEKKPIRLSASKYNSKSAKKTHVATSKKKGKANVR